MPLPTGDPGDVEISFGDIIGNRGQAESDVEIKAESEFFALGASVGDVDGNGTPDETADRDALDAAPYSISEFYGAQYPNVFFDNPIAKVGTTSVMSNGYVDGETARIYFDVNLDQTGTTDYTAGLKYASNNTVVVEDDGGSADPLRDLSVADNTHYADMTIPNIGGANDVYYPFVTTGPYSNAVGANINHYDQLAGGSTNLTTDGSTGYTSTTVDAAGEAVTAVVVGGSVSTGTQASITNGSITSITAGDGGTMTGTYGSGEASQTATIANTPGVIRFALTHNGSPTSARNNTTSTQDFTVTYNVKCDSIASDDYTVNSGTAFTITAVSEGVTSKTMRMGYGTANDDTSYTAYSDKSISDSRFVRDTQTNAFTVTLTSGTSLATYYPKAHHTSGTTGFGAGSAIYIAPAFSYSTTGDQTINVNATQAMAASSVVGNSANVAIASSPSSQTGNNSVTFTPGTSNGVYTINYTGTANYSQTSNTTDTLTVRPIVSLSRSTATVYGFGSYATNTTPTGVSTTNVVVTANTTGTVSVYNWTKPSGTTASGGGSGDPTVTMNFSGASGTKSFSATVAGTAVGGSNTTSTSDSIDVAYVAYTQQNITSVTPTSGDYRRGATTISVAWTSINVALVDIHLVASSAGTSTTQQVNANDSMDSANTSEGQSYSAAIADVGVSNVGSYHVRVQDDSDGVPSTTAVSTINVLDTAPTTPGAFNDTAGGYNGSLTMDWGASSYRYQYQIYKSSGDSDGSYSQLGSNQTGTSVGLSEASSTSTYGPFYYKVRALNFAQGPLSTEYSSYNTARRFIIYPTLDAGNNIPQPASSTIYSTTQNTTSTSTVMNVTSDSDNVTGYSWATSLTSGASINNASIQNPTITAGSGVGTIQATLTVSGNSSQTYAHSTDNITVNYYPKIYDITFTGGTIIVSTTNLYIQSITWQGFQSAGFIARVYTSSGGGGSEVGQYEPEINDVGGITFASDCLDNDTGGVQKTGRVWSNASSANIGTVSSTGTVYLRVVDAGGSYAYEESLTITDYNSVALGGYQLGGANAGFDDQEDAEVPNIPGGASPYSATGYYLGTLGSGTVQILSSKGGSGFAGGNKWWDFPSNYIGYIDGSGNLTAANYIADANAQPKAPTSITFSSVTSTQIVIGWSDNSAIEDGFKVYMNTGGAADSGDTLINTASANATSYTKTGLTADTTYYFAVYAYNGTALSSVLQGSQATLVATEWTASPSNFPIEVSSGTQTSSNKSYTLAGGSGNSTFTLTHISGDSSFFNQYFAVGTSDNPTNWTSPGGTITLSANSTYKMRVKHDHRASFEGNSGVYRLAATNNSEVDNCDITFSVASGGFGGS